jgi:hypothetical protein
MPMTVRMILPDIEAGALHAKRRVTAFPYLKSKNTVTTTALITREAIRDDIIRLTLTA